MLKRYWLIFLIMALLTPLGLLAEGTAWGEWGPEDLAAMLGFVPKGIDQASSWWQALLPDYSVKGVGEKAGYVISALAGSALVYLAAMAYMKAIARSK
ncbi:PDGLE domain-containing protein [Anaeroselena agilis]|uniref:PDGLE domain-containing protein n=1 Tax=Anaeroselena agilis TaxID=3063788 RepID=A0ABU3P1S7_9FIRM|nr:PDGLE domain-containing protein [Selenomonadales bacterium 4137-cl]